VDVGTIEAALKLRDDASAALARFGGNLTRLAATGREVGESLSRIGLGLTAGVVVPFVAVIKSAKDFESAFANVVKTVEGFDVDAFGKLDEDAQRFRDAILDLSREIPIAADQLANIAAIGGQFGVAKEDLLGFTETVAKLGVAVDGIEAETAAAALAQIANVTREGKGAFEEYANVLVDLGNKGNSTEADILEFSKRLAGAGSQAGLSGAEIFGLGAAMANVGLNAEAGGTAMSRLLSQMSRAGAEGAEASQKFAEFAGRVDASVASGEGFAKLFKEDASKALELFFNGLSDAAAKGANLNMILTDLGVNEVRQRDTMLRLAGATGEVAKSFDQARDAAAAGSALNEEVRKKFATFDNQLKLFLATVKLVAIEVGTPLLTALRGVLETMKPVTDGLVALARQFADLPPVVHTATVALGAGAGLTGILLLLGGQAAKAAADIGRLIEVIRGLATAQGASAVSNVASSVSLLGANASTSTASVIKLSSASTAFGYSVTAMAPAATEATKQVGLLGSTAVRTAGVWGLLAAAGVAAAVAVREITGSWDAHLKVATLIAPATTAIVNAYFGLRDSFAGMVDVGKRVVAVLDDMRVVLGDKLSTAFQIVSQKAQPLLTTLQVAASVARSFGEALIERVQGGLTTFRDLVVKAVPGAQLLAQAMAFATGKSSEWAASLKEQADIIRSQQGLMPKHTADIKLSADAQTQAAAAAADSTDKLAKSRAELDRLMAAVKALTPEQRKLIDGWAAAGRDAEDIAKRTGIAEQTVAAYQKTAQAATKAQTALAKETAVASDAFEQFAKEGVAAVEARLRAIGALDAGKFDDITEAQLRLNKAMAQFSDNIDIRRTTQGLSKDFVAVVRDVRAFSREMDDLRKEADAADPELRDFYDRLMDLKQADFAGSIEEAVTQTEEFRLTILALNPTMGLFLQHMQDSGEASKEAVEKTKDWTQALSGIANAFGNLKDMGGGLGFAAEFVIQADIALQAFGKTREGIREFAKGAKADLTAAFADMAAGIAGGFAGLISATGPGGSMADRMLGGALQGASLGASIGSTVGATIASSAAQGAAYGGAWGAAAGVIVGIMVAYFRGREARRQMEAVGEAWGISISEGLNGAINKISFDEFFGNRVAGELFKFADILREGGGLNDLNFDRLTAKLRDVFVMLETGVFSTEQALHVMEENFSAFAGHVIDSGRFASEGFLEILELNIRNGLMSPEIAGYIRTQATAIGEGLAAMLQPVLAIVGPVGDRVKAAQAALTKLTQDGKQGTEEWTRAQAELTEALRHQGEVAVRTQGDIDNIGVIALGMFQRAIDSGVSFIEALNAIGPALDAIIVAQQNLGVEGTNAAGTQRVHRLDLTHPVPQLVGAAAALGSTLVALQQSGGLTVDTLKAMADQGLRTFNRLIDAGFQENEALALMAGYLKNVEKAHRQLGLPIDENTQRLLDQARAAGLLGDEAVSATEQQRRGFEMVTRAINQLIVTLGGVPIAIDDISQALDDLPDTVTVEVDVKMPSDLPDHFERPYVPGGGTADPYGPGGMFDPAAVAAATASERAQGYDAGMTQTIVVDIDGEIITRTVARGLPDHLRLRAAEAGT
jgi:TP901 family phage tail tape measure protein